MAKKLVKDYKKTYSRTVLRARLKEKIQKGSKGGKSDQWTARKAQLLVKTYEKNKGKYKKMWKRDNRKNH